MFIKTTHLKYYPAFVMLFFAYTFSNGQQVSPTKDKGNLFTVVSYNVENLFDTINDPLTLDDEFTPSGSKSWTFDRYKKKLVDLAKVISSINKSELPEIIGLCEVENEKVLSDLAGTGKLKRGNYGIIHHDSPDKRGIDVALLYRGDAFTPLEIKNLPIHFRRDTTQVRDILLVKGRTDNSEVFYFLLNHWKSRSGGRSQTEQKRMYSAVVLRKAIDSILNFEPNAKIISMGDFNDEPTNTSIYYILRAGNKRKNLEQRDLYNLMYDQHNLGDVGTYHFQGNWNMLDQIIVSPMLLKDHKGYHTTYDGGKIFKKEWMLYDNPKAGAQVPNKTYGGDTYFGGISDHLPVYLILNRK